MEPWQRVWIDANTYSQDLHSYINCTECHGGQSVDDMEAAHDGMLSPSDVNSQDTCGECHTDVAPAYMNSLHITLKGYDTIIYQRSAPEHYETLEYMETFHCNSCHTSTSCGDCHISQPGSVGGGLLNGHTFVQTPPMSQTCTACHGSRVKNEYYGLNEGVPSDVHFRSRMSCADCHTADEIHGLGLQDVNHRYDGAREPSCISCHEDQVGVGSGIEQHELHGTEILSCQTCHSTSYTNCVNCHVEQTDDSVPFYRIEEHSMDFAIGLNPRQNAERPYMYTTLRHVPIDINSFDFYGDDLLPNFDRLPTWVYATPHNIQRNTPQTESCTNCHGNDAVFLTADKVAEAELAANRSVMVDAAPPLPAGYEHYVEGLEPEAPADSGGDGFWGEGGAASAPPASDDGGFWGDEPAPAAEAPADDFWGEPAAPATSAPPADDFWGSAGASPTATPSSAADFWGAPDQAPAESTPTPVGESFWGS